MNTVLQHPLSQFQHLSMLSNREGMIAFALQEGIPVLRASKAVQERVEELLQKQREAALSDAEREEFESYEEIDDYLSLLNRITRNLFLGKQPSLLYDISTQNTASLATADS